jgi:serine/threonine-protein kinase HipA
MSVNGKFKDFTEEDLLAVADRFAIGTAATVIDRVRSAIKEWRSYAEKAAVSAGQAQHIEGLLLPLG